MAIAPEELQGLPVVDADVLASMHDAHEANPNDSHDITHSTVEDDQQFEFEILRQGFIRSQGNPDKQYAFIEGANFAREALKRTLAVKDVDDQALFGEI